MAKISTYVVHVPRVQDILLGTQVYTESDPLSIDNPTRNFTIQSIVTLANAGGGTGISLDTQGTSGLATLTAGILNIPDYSADPAIVKTTGTQTIGGAKTFTTNIVAPNVTNDNTGDQSLSIVGNVVTISGTNSSITVPSGFITGLSTDNTSGNAAVLAGILNIPNYLSDASIVKTSGTQTIAGVKTFTSNISASNLSNNNTGDQSLSIAGNIITISGTSSSVTLPTGGTVTSLSVTGASGAAATLISGVLNIPTPVIPAASIITSLSTVGTSGDSTLISGVLNIPNYANTEYTLTSTGASGAAATLVGTVINVPTPVIPAVNFTSLATVGTSGAATLVSGVLNIPNYATASGTFLPLAGGEMTGTITSAAAANLIVKPGTSIIEVQGDGTSVEGAIKLNCAVNSHGQTLKAQPHSEQITNTMLMPKGVNSTLVSEATETGVTSESVSTGTSTGTPLTAVIVGRTLQLTANIYNGAGNLGFVPAGGDNTKFLRGDGQWFVPSGGGGGSGTVTAVAALTLGTAGTDLASTVADGATTPVITLNVPTASATNRGALSSTDWTTFNNKTSTTGTVTSVSSSIAGTAFSSNITNASTTPAIAITTNGATTDYINGEGDYIPFPSIPAGTVTSVTGTAPIVSSAGATPAISISTMTAATAGAGGLKGAVPGSAAGDQLKFLRADASWQTIAGGTTVVDNLTTTSATSALSANQGVVLKGLIDTNVTAIGLNTAKTGITSTQAANIVTNNGKTGISSTQAANIVTNNGKVTDTGLPAILNSAGSASLTAGITALDVRNEIGAGTSSLAIGTTNTTALAGNTTTISTVQATAINKSVKNDTDIYNTPDVEKIISLTQAQYTAITTPNINTLYIII